MKVPSRFRFTRPANLIYGVYDRESGEFYGKIQRTRDSWILYPVYGKSREVFVSRETAAGLLSQESRRA